VKVILTGATGLIGQAVAERLSKSSEVICLGRRPATCAARVEHIEADLLSPSFLRVLPQRADAVIHLAQCERYSEFPDAADEIFAVNVGGLAKLLEWARGAGVKSFVHASTGGLYGRGSRPFKETDPIRIEGPLAFYFRTKQAAEILAEGYRDYFTVVALRPFFVYGPGQRTTMLVPRLIRSVRESRFVTLAGRDGMQLNPVHVFDVAASIERSLTLTASDTINVAGPEVLSLRAMVEAIGRALGRLPVFDLRGELPGYHVIGDTERMVERLIAPTIRFADAVRGLLDLSTE
jgi:UDP-glucose 4-epimerase